MRLEDFCRCTPSQFGEIHSAWLKEREYESRRGWEQARFLAMAAVQPYSKKALKLSDIAVFPWEKPVVPKTKQGEASTQERMMQVLSRLG